MIISLMIILHLLVMNKKEVLIQLALLFYMKSNTNNNETIEAAEHIAAQHIKSYNLSQNDILKTRLNLSKFINSF